MKEKEQTEKETQPGKAVPPNNKVKAYASEWQSRKF